MARKEAERLVSLGVARWTDPDTIVIRAWKRKYGADQGEITVHFPQPL